MPEVKYFINVQEPNAIPLAEEMRSAGIRFSSLPTSGPVTLCVDGATAYGPSEVGETVRVLVSQAREKSAPPESDPSSSAG